MNKFAPFISIAFMLAGAMPCYAEDGKSDDIRELQEKVDFVEGQIAALEFVQPTSKDRLGAAINSPVTFRTIERAGEDISDIKKSISVMEKAVIRSTIQMEDLGGWRGRKDELDEKQSVSILENTRAITETRGNIKSIISWFLGLASTGLMFLWKMHTLKKKKISQSQRDDFENEELLR